MKRLLVLACGVLICACGATHTAERSAPAGRCPTGRAFMGCATSSSAGLYATTAPHGTTTTTGVTVVGQVRFPDVSSWQGCQLNWSRIGAVGAAFKLGEGLATDRCAAHNNASLAAAGKARAPYWFVRPIGATHEAAAIVDALKTIDITVGRVVIYTAPGTWDGGATGGLGLWQAEYGPVLHPAWTPILAWQCSDGTYGCVTLIHGLGYGDVSIDYGLLALSPHVLVLDMEVPGLAGYAPVIAAYVLAHDRDTPPPGPSASQVRRWRRALAASQRAYTQRGCPLLKQRIDWFAGRQHGPRGAAHTRALHASEHAWRERGCGVLEQRVRYYQRRLTAR